MMVPPRYDVPIHDCICYNCKKSGHISHNCPQQGRCQEAPGRSKGLPATKSSHSAVLESKESKDLMSLIPENLSTQQLQDLLTRCQLQDEQMLLESDTNIVM